nr:MAG TPA: hypothetical protein [Caudoviricetes sp.]
MESFRDLFVIIVAGIIRLVRKELRYRMRNCIPFYITEAEIWLLHDFYILKGLSFKLNLILVSLYLAKDFIHDLAERKRIMRKRRHQK